MNWVGKKVEGSRLTSWREPSQQPFPLLLQRTQEIQHNPIELSRFLHIEMMGGTWNDHFLRSRNALFENIGNLQNVAYILITDNYQRGNMYLREP